MIRIGFMGLGIMGSAMARNLLRAGFPLMVYNRTAAKTEPLAAAGAQVAPSPLALAHDTEVLIAMVTGPEALEALLWGEEGAAGALGPGKTFINMSSVSPAYTLELAEQLQPLGVEFIDAPVSGTKKPAEEGTLIILAGGSQKKITALAPIWQALGRKVVYCGPVGQGSMMKMTVNLLLGVMLAGLTEAVNFGRRGGLGPGDDPGGDSCRPPGVRHVSDEGRPAAAAGLSRQLPFEAHDQRPEIYSGYSICHRGCHFIGGGGLATVPAGGQLRLGGGGFCRRGQSLSVPERGVLRFPGVVKRPSDRDE